MATPPPYHQPPMYSGGAMPPPPIAPPPPGAHPIPPNAHVYAHVYLLHWAHDIFVNEYGGPQHKTFDWFNSITRVRVKFKVMVNGRELKHDFDWKGPAPPQVVDLLNAEPVPVHESPALGMYHPEVRRMSDKVEDAALVAAMDYAIDWALKVHNYRADPFRDIVKTTVELDLRTAEGQVHEHEHRHEGGPDDRMMAFKSAASRVRGW